MAIKNLLNQRFGKLTVIQRDETKKGQAAYWICQCDCGKIKSIRGSNLTAKTNPTQSCGCLRAEKLKEKIDLTSQIGKKFGRLTILERDINYPIGHSCSSVWKCQCDCGEIVSVSLSELKSGHTKSCGCYRSELVTKNNSIELTNKKFGMLTVLKRLPEKHPKAGWLWECECNCGNICFVPTNYLTSGTVFSCKKHNLSKGELKIIEILTENNISFIHQYSFPELISDKNGLLRYDFAILNENNEVVRLVEFDGEQHHNINSYYYSEQLIKNDLKKNEFAKNNNIPLVRIPYNQLKTINLSTILDNNYILK